jgi:hypothetical protein
MRFKTIDWLKPADEELIASFGEARLVRDLDGKFELRGGTAEDRTAAKEWISLFMHEAVPCVCDQRSDRAIPADAAGS